MSATGRSLSEALHDLADRFGGAADSEQAARRAGRRRRRARMLLAAGITAGLAGLGAGTRVGIHWLVADPVKLARRPRTSAPPSALGGQLVLSACLPPVTGRFL